ncbi:hypothetical protein L596_004061 [Steinernema carpocapsae]|uniref:Uncharacterized protein n=1 Tax=Steinernema carpocapsae TaxID=34508 RepID=A0A4U8UW65_STECR|nr:hypothetical protein L596_004061 [Steinernema carpocapsae]
MIPESATGISRRPSGSVTQLLLTLYDSCSSFQIACTVHSTPSGPSAVPAGLPLGSSSTTPNSTILTCPRTEVSTSPKPIFAIPHPPHSSDTPTFLTRLSISCQLLSTNCLLLSSVRTTFA